MIAWFTVVQIAVACAAGRPTPQPTGGEQMDPEAKRTTLRMIPYGIYILTVDDGAGNVGAATVN